MADNFGRSIFYGLAAVTTIVTVSVIGGIPFVCAGVCLGYVYYNGEVMSVWIKLGLKPFYSRQGVRSDSTRYEAPWCEFCCYLYNQCPNIVYEDSVTRSPLYSIYGETIAGVTILRAFGASSKFLRDMIRCVDTVSRLLMLVLWRLLSSLCRMPIPIIGCGELTAGCRLGSAYSPVLSLD